MEIQEGNKFIAEFMGYKYFEANVHDHDGGRMDNVYSKVPIDIFEDDGCKFFKDLPNPDYQKPKPTKWNPSFGKLSWQTVNHSEFIYGVLEYNTSWDWLMPVVEKIEKDFANDFEIAIYSSSCYIQKWNKEKQSWDSFVSGVGKKIEAVYESVIQFIEWYNQQSIQNIN